MDLWGREKIIPKTRHLRRLKRHLFQSCFTRFLINLIYAKRSTSRGGHHAVLKYRTGMCTKTTIKKKLTLKPGQVHIHPDYIMLHLYEYHPRLAEVNAPIRS